MKNNNQLNTLANIRWLYEEHKQQFMRYFGSSVDTQTLEDIYHDSWEAVCKKIEKQELEIARLGNYLLTVCKHKVYDLFKKEKTLKLDDMLISNDDYALTLLKGEDEREEALTILDELMTEADEKCKTIFRLFFHEKKSMEEIALEMGYRSKDVAKRRNYLCKETFAKAMVTRLESIGINWRTKR